MEFGTLLFFAALFVMMKALDQMGVLAYFANLTADLIVQVPAGINLDYLLYLKRNSNLCVFHKRQSPIGCGYNIGDLGRWDGGCLHR